MNKKEISMKKGQKVRILRTNQVATIVEVELIRKGGKVHRYCHLKVDNKPDLWLDSSELGDWWKGAGLLSMMTEGRNYTSMWSVIMVRRI